MAFTLTIQVLSDQVAALSECGALHAFYMCQVSTGIICYTGSYARRSSSYDGKASTFVEGRVCFSLIQLPHRVLFEDNSLYSQAPHLRGCCTVVMCYAVKSEDVLGNCVQ